MTEVSEACPQPQGFIEVGDIVKLAFKMAAQHKSCFSCAHCDVENNLCRKFGSQPPLRIIKVGCPQYELDMPF